MLEQTTSGTPSTWATTKIHGKFDTTLLEINFKFILGSSSNVLGALVNCFYNFVE